MIQIRIAFVLRLVDDFTGTCIKRKSFRFWTDEKILHPVQKEEGLYVFLEPLEHPARITIEGTDYYPCTVEVDNTSWIRRNPLQISACMEGPARSIPEVGNIGQEF